MSKTPEKSVSEGSEDKSPSLAKKPGIYSLFNSRRIPCSEDKKCPYYWIKHGDVWELLDKKGGKPILEADDVVDYVESDMKDCILDFAESTPIIRIFHSDSGRGFIADDGTIVKGDYVDMSLYDLQIDNYDYPIISGKTLESGQEKTRYFSLKDGFKTDDLELMKQKCIEENPNHNNDKENSKKEKRKKFQDKVKSTIKTTGKAVKENFDKFAVACIDEQYNRAFSINISLKQGTKQGRSYMKNGKVGIMGILEPKYEDVAPCSDNYIWIKLGKKRGLIDADGNMVIEPKYDKIYEDGRVTVKNEYILSNGSEFVVHNMGLIDIKAGREIIDPKYDKIYEDGRVVKNEYILFSSCVGVIRNMGLIDIRTGREIIDPNKNKYSSIKYPFKGYSVVIAEYSGKYGLISTIDGRIIKDFDYKSYRIDRKNKKLSLCKDRNNVEVFDCSPFKEAA